MSALSTHCINEVLMINSSIIKGHLAQFPAKALPPSQKETCTPKKILTFREMKLSCLLALLLKKFSYFLKRNLFSYFWKWNTPLPSPSPKKIKNIPFPPKKIP